MKADAVEIIENWKIHPSALGNLMTCMSGLTPAQARTLAELENKPKLTDKQLGLKIELEAKRDAPDELPEGAKTWLRSQYNEIVHGVKPVVQTKPMQKGIAAETDAIELLNKVLDRKFQKNQISKQNAWLIGTADIVDEDYIIDIKCSWDWESFYVAKSDPMYEWQLRAYMMLYGKPKAALAYCLVDTPQFLIYDEVNRQCYAHGVDIESDSGQHLTNQITNNMTFSDKWKPEQRVKLLCFDFDNDDYTMLKAWERVGLAREYLMQFHEEINLVAWPKLM
jgi:hypothetical protein